MSVDVSIVVPVFNEADNILPLTREIAAAMQRVRGGYELVLVDDASTDRTWENIRAARRLDSRVRGLRHARNAGQSAALWTGIRASSGSILATLDGDLQNDPADLPRMIAELSRVDFVIGVRLNRQDDFVRRISSRIAWWARQRVLKVGIRDTGCAIRAFKRSALNGVFPFNGLHRFLPVLVQGNGSRTLEMPVNHRPRIAGVSKYGVMNRLWRGIYDLIAISWYQKRRLHPVAFSELRESSEERDAHALTKAEKRRQRPLQNLR